jgi:hypothetical protein
VNHYEQFIEENEYFEQAKEVTMAKSKRRKAIMEPGCNKDMVESQEPII